MSVPCLPLFLLFGSCLVYQAISDLHHGFHDSVGLLELMRNCEHFKDYFVLWSWVKAAY